MTICVAVRVAEGLVMAADSAATLFGKIADQQVVTKTFMYANKVSQFKDYPIGVMSWGAGGINDRSIQSLIMEFEYNFSSRSIGEQNYNVKEIADGLLTFFKERYGQAFSSQPEKPALGLLVGGYSAKEFFSEEYMFEFPNVVSLQNIRPNLPDGRPDFSINWFGVTNALVRLFQGFNPLAIEELINRGAPKEIVEKWINDRVSQAQIIFNGMPIQDAVDLATYCVEVVIGSCRFESGAPACTPPIDVCVITPSAFKWARRKQWAIKD